MARTKKALGDNPLFNPAQDPKGTDPVSAVEVTEETLKQVEMLYKNMKRAYQKKTAKKQNQEGEYTRMTFIVNRELLQKLREYAEQEQITVKEALERTLRNFFETEK